MELLFKITTLAFSIFLLANFAGADSTRNQKEKSNNKIFIEADQVEIVEEKDQKLKKHSLSKILLTGTVTIKLHDTKIQADKIMIEKKTSDERDLIASANKANYVTFTQTALDQQTQKSITTKGRAKKITYNSKTRIAILKGDAFLQNNQNQIQAEEITYNAVNGQYSATQGSKSGRVQIIITPE